MKLWRGIVLGLIVGSLIHLWLVGWETWSDSWQIKWNKVRELPAVMVDHYLSVPQRIPAEEREETLPVESVQNKETTEKHTAEAGFYSISDPGLYVALGMTAAEVREKWGNPERIDPSAYGYEWWIYNHDWEAYVQIGIKDNQVNTVYTNAPGWQWKDWRVGQEREEWAGAWSEQEEYTFTYQWGYYSFVLSEDDIRERPLYLEDDFAVQLYIDLHGGESIAGIRLMDLETLLLHRPYTLKYVGSLPEPSPLNEQERQAVDQANERQIFDMVNVTRTMIKLTPFDWHDGVADVARRHSQDMLENNYFDHYSPHYGDLGERLQRGGVTFAKAGENIAWNYVDAADVHHGWLNSPGHRQNIVEPAFTHLGVGVVDKYYTQNFVKQ
ncbi:uncharacterized protein YkwD [Caldalkalibacillus uzonensis]|uniref:Uncharacterized protein YkwD n=1 Tax=Caldalkalibacillus uzonensis TaxID=353224 RepID=A0ABU0CW25_9BACI|nr:CAP domain-containing protein [Caldalkalibacillus uzonensis]MDQ0340308.1 uncharacterized protein YkwD [Caldalkalibacillus uzonensis]